MSLQEMQSNIEHVVHLMFENRGFDHLLGWLYDVNRQPKVHIPALRPGELEFYGIPHDAQLNPLPWLPGDASFYEAGPEKYTGKRHHIHRGTWGYCYMPACDPGEGWQDVGEQIFGPSWTEGKLGPPLDWQMYGFYLNYQKQRFGVGSDRDILATCTPEELPVMHTLAESFAVSDMWFCSAPTQTNPNRAFSLGGSSQGRRDNCTFNGKPFDTLRTIFTVLGEQGHSWKLYADHHWMLLEKLYFTQYLFPMGMEHGSFGSIGDFAADVANDALPRFTYIEPAFFGEATWPPFGTDYHPPFKLKDGEWFLKKIYDILRTHPAVFEKTLFIVTFDEHGGTYDHLVPPANAVRPSSEPYDLPFGRYGLRVPTLLISPCVPAGCVFRAGYYPETPETTTPHPYDHTSVLATLMKWLNIPYGDESSPGWLGARTAVAPTFEEVIGPVQNTTWPDVKPFHCHDTWFGKEIPDELIPQLVERISGFERGTAQHAELVTHVQSAPTERDAHRRLLQLREMHGDRPRNGDLCCASATSVPSG